MADTIYYHLKPAAEAELVRRKREILARCRLIGPDGFPLLRSAQAREMLAELDREFYRDEFMQVADGSRIVETRCGSCLRRHQMPADVVTYKCPCAPSTERNALNDRAMSDAAATIIGGTPA